MNLVNLIILDNVLLTIAFFKFAVFYESNQNLSFIIFCTFNEKTQRRLSECFIRFLSLFKSLEIATDSFISHFHARGGKAQSSFPSFELI